MRFDANDESTFPKKAALWVVDYEGEYTLGDDDGDPRILRWDRTLWEEIGVTAYYPVPGDDDIDTLARRLAQRVSFEHGATAPGWTPRGAGSWALTAVTYTTDGTCRPLVRERVFYVSGDNARQSLRAAMAQLDAAGRRDG